MSGNLYGKGTMSMSTMGLDDGDYGHATIAFMSTTSAIPRDVYVVGVTLNKETLKIDVEDTETLIAIIDPFGADDQTVTWKSDDETVATVDEDGVVTGISEGEATITVTTTDGEETAKCVVTVVISVTGITLDEETLALTASGATGTLVATVAPATATVDTVTWSTSDKTVATVVDGVVTPLTAGETIITATTTDGGFTATCVVTVSE